MRKNVWRATRKRYASPLSKGKLKVNKFSEFCSDFRFDRSRYKQTLTFRHLYGNFLQLKYLYIYIHTYITQIFRNNMHVRIYYLQRLLVYVRSWQ